MVQHWATKTRLVKSLSGGAHFLFPGNDGSGTVAVRVYEKGTIEKIEENLTSRPPQRCEEDIQNICSFVDAYKYPVIFIVLPQGEMQEKQLRDIRSFTMRVQSLVSFRRLIVRRDKGAVAKVCFNVLCVNICCYKFNPLICICIRQRVW